MATTQRNPIVLTLANAADLVDPADRVLVETEPVDAQPIPEPQPATRPLPRTFSGYRWRRFEEQHGRQFDREDVAVVDALGLVLVVAPRHQGR